MEKQLNIKKLQPNKYALAQILMSIKDYDARQAYGQRNQLVYAALSMAAMQGIPCGIRNDPAEPEWPVVFIELPNGQVAWHVPQHGKPWDGHDLISKNMRLDGFALMCGVPTGPTSDRV